MNIFLSVGVAQVEGLMRKLLVYFLASRTGS